MLDATVVVPCFNEAGRLDGQGFRAFGREADLLFVDDGSTDATGPALDALARDLTREGLRASTFTLDGNHGKGEAVRRGMRAALARGAEIVGYYDADLATPPAEMMRIVGVVASGAVDVAIGARVALLGHTIERKALRHYLGRVFATAASLLLRIPVYDTQCGAKAFRRTPALEAALDEPFVGRWAFDVELLGRLLAGAKGVPPVPLARIEEVPLRAWHDVGGSTLKGTDFPRLGLELVRIARNLARWERDAR